MEYLQGITSISNSNNITSILLTTNKRKLNLQLDYTLNHNKDCISYNYNKSIFDYCKDLNIDTLQYRCK